MRLVLSKIFSRLQFYEIYFYFQFAFVLSLELAHLYSWSLLTSYLEFLNTQNITQNHRCYLFNNAYHILLFKNYPLFSYPQTPFSCSTSSPSSDLFIVYYFMCLLLIDYSHYLISSLKIKPMVFGCIETISGTQQVFHKHLLNG